MTAKKTKKRSFIKWVFIILTFLASICLILSYAAYYINPEKVWYMAFFGLAYPLILSVNILFMLLWLILLKKYMWIPLITILVGFSHVLSILQIRSGEQVPVSGSFKIVSFNVHGGTEYSKNPSQNGNLPSLINFIRDQDPDILCLQEFYLKRKDSIYALKEFADSIGMKYFYFNNYYLKRKRTRIEALVIFSKFPIIRKAFLQFDHSSTFAIYTDIKIKDEIIRVFNVHLESFQFGQDDYTFYSNIAEAETPKTPLKEGSMKIYLKLRKSYELRAKQVDKLRSDINKSPYPKLVCGDLNDTPTSYSYQVVSKGMTDAFKESGSGIFGNTYRGNFPSFRIDYILTDKKFEAYKYMKHPVDFSDHFPISTFVNIHPAK